MSRQRLAPAMVERYSVLCGSHRGVDCSSPLICVQHDDQVPAKQHHQGALCSFSCHGREPDVSRAMEDMVEADKGLVRDGSELEVGHPEVRRSVDAAAIRELQCLAAVPRPVPEQCNVSAWPHARTVAMLRQKPVRLKVQRPSTLSAVASVANLLRNSSVAGTSPRDRSSYSMRVAQGCDQRVPSALALAILCIRRSFFRADCLSWRSAEAS